ncbi:MAG: hypothetical protein EAZ55_12045 [Cytophagales bacterium]|nr:MAG: hypothetical protein EAZ55_12045 [Cytophagales bacterium]
MKYFLSYLLLCTCYFFAQAQPKYEMRGVWITTVFGNDYPSQINANAGLTQKKELEQMIEKLASQGFNCIFLQVRPAADAFYDSPFEPWSEWLTGKQGEKPNPMFDPLEVAVAACRKHQIEIHAWINPYRAVFNIEKSNLSTTHPLNQHPEWFMSYGKKKLFNPALPEVRNYITQIATYLVQKYDIDGIHLDDYFYPYPENNIELNDQYYYTLYRTSEKQNIADWRRENINALISLMSKKIKEVKPYIKFGVSPFGVWRNKKDDVLGSDTQAGQPSYDNLYADIRKWLQNAWIDYAIPQIYWSMEHPKANFRTLVQWWAENSFGKHIYIGHALYKIEDQTGDTRWNLENEIPQQIRFVREKAVQGSAFFRAKFLLKNSKSIVDSLAQFYQVPALCPTMTWIDSIAPEKITEIEVIKDPEYLQLKWQAPNAAIDGEQAYRYLVYRVPLDNPFIEVEDMKQVVYLGNEPIWKDYATTTEENYLYCITALDRMNNESAPQIVYVFRAGKDPQDSSLIWTNMPLKKKKVDTSLLK